MFIIHVGMHCQSFRKAPHIHDFTMVKLGLRKEKDTLHPESVLLSGKTTKGEKRYEEQQSDQHSPGS